MSSQPAHQLELPSTDPSSPRSDGLYVQYGCGLVAPEGWVNFDASPTLRAQRLPVLGLICRKTVAPLFPSSVRIGDIVRGLPLQNDSCQGIYCSHVLEHLSLEDCRTAIRHSFQYLRRGGRFRLVLPDLRFMAEQYLASSDHDASIAFMDKSLLGKRERPRSLAGFLRAWLSNANHLWMWDERSLRRELIDAGFCDVRRAQFGDSPDSRFRTVETESRWDNCLGMECIK